MTRDEQMLVDALKKHAAKHGGVPDFPYDNLRFTIQTAAQTIQDMSNKIDRLEAKATGASS